ncbi:MAG: hypothetical protein MUC78_12935 [Bacteroidales bacterium]|nr:hypothetical protein [Bacteroidales bacterium]
MKTEVISKKVWVKPSVQMLNISKDTFSGSRSGKEAANKYVIGVANPTAR